MVQLQFTIEVEAPHQDVWRYFGNFENINDWDPNSTRCDVVKKTESGIGSVYNVGSVFNGNESTVTYETVKIEETSQKGYICLEGKNDMITALDEIICTEKGPSLTQVQYRADICLRGIKVLFTPFIIPGLNKITEQAKQGMIQKAIKLFGKAK